MLCDKYVYILIKKIFFFLIFSIMYEYCVLREVYDVMCEFFGILKDVVLRRDVMDINEILIGYLYVFYKNKKYWYF